ALASSVRGVRDVIRAPLSTGSSPCKGSSWQSRLSSARRRLFDLASVRQPERPCTPVVASGRVCPGLIRLRGGGLSTTDRARAQLGALGTQQPDGGNDCQQRQHQRPHEGVSEGGGNRSTDLVALARGQW